MNSMTNKAVAEFIGTYWLVLGGCGSAVLAAAFPDVGIGLLGVSLAFGLTVVTMAYAIGHISGCHLNPAVTVGLWAGGRFDAKEMPLYIVAQVLGAIAAAYTLYVIASGQPGYMLEPNGLAVNGVDDPFAGRLFDVCRRPHRNRDDGFFLLIIMGSTHSRAPAGFAPLAIGLGLTLIHLISIPVTNTSVNPARSTGPALIVGGLALQQLWIFWVAPIVGAVIGGGLYRWLSPEAAATARHQGRLTEIGPASRPGFSPGRAGSWRMTACRYRARQPWRRLRRRSPSGARRACLAKRPTASMRWSRRSIACAGSTASSGSKCR